ncbi:MAG: prepilin peptidase [Oscillospiraceae bacterium]
MIWSYYILWFCFIFVSGIAVGSFLNVCIYRLPLEESIVTTGSHCMKCGTKIRRRDLIPVLSWILLRGKCRDCGEKIPARYMLVELLNGLIWVGVMLRIDFFEFPIHAILVCLLLSALVVVFFMDWDTQLISVPVVIFILLLGIAERFLSEKSVTPALLEQIIGFFAVSVILLIIVIASRERAMGIGDVYLMAAGGFFIGWKSSLAAFLIGLVSASVVGMILKHRTGDSKFAFGPFLSLGLGTAALYGNELVAWYLHFIGRG